MKEIIQSTSGAARFLVVARDMARDPMPGSVAHQMMPGSEMPESDKGSNRLRV